MELLANKNLNGQTEGTSTAATHDFVKLMDTYRKMGYAYVRIQLVNGDTYCVLPEDIYYLSTLYILKYNDCSEMFYLSQYGEELTYDVFMEYFNQFVRNMNTKLPNLKDSVRELLNRYDHPIMNVLEKTQISAFGDLIQLGRCCKDITLEFDSDQKRNRVYVQKDVVEYITVSMHNIVTITPCRLDPKFEVTDKALVKALNDLRTEDTQA